MDVCQPVPGHFRDQPFTLALVNLLGIETYGLKPDGLACLRFGVYLSRVLHIGTRTQNLCYPLATLYPIELLARVLVPHEHTI